MFARLWIDNSLKEQHITDIKWQVGSIGIKNTHITALEFTLQDRFKFQIQNLDILWSFSQTPADGYRQFIDALSIQALTINNRSNDQPNQAMFRDTASNISGNTPLVEHLNLIIAVIKQSSQPSEPLAHNLATNLALTDTEYLAYVPKIVNIDKIQYSQPCIPSSTGTSSAQPPTTKSCTAIGNLKWVNQITEPEISSKLTFKLQDASQQNLLIDTQLNLTAKLEDRKLMQTRLNAALNLIDKNLSAEQSVLKLQWHNQTSNLAKNQLHTNFQIQTQPGLVTEDFATRWQEVNSIYRNWSGKDLAFSPKVQPQLDLAIEAHFDLSQLNGPDESNPPQALQALLNNLMKHSDFNLHFAASSKQPLEIKNQAEINGNLQAELTAKHGEIKQYQLQGSGKLAFINDSAADNWLNNHKISLPEMAFEIKSQNQLALKLDQLDNLNATQSQFPFSVLLNSINNQTTPSQKVNGFKLDLQGRLQLKQQPTIEITSGKLLAELPYIQFNPSNQSEHNRAELEFTAQANLDSWKILSKTGSLKSNLTTQLTTNSTTADKKRADKLDIRQATLVWQDLELTANKKPINPKINLTQTSGVFNSTIESMALQANISHPLVQAEKLQLNIKQFALTPVIANQKTANPNLGGYQIDAQYQLASSKVVEPHLLTQSWKGFGKTKVNYQFEDREISQIQLQGSISNKAGLVVFHNAFYTPSQIYSDWFIPPIYFLAGNSLQKTFKDWPKLVNVGSGKIQAKGTTKLRFTDADATKPLLDNLYSQGEVSAQSLSGILSETTFNQISTDMTFELNKNALSLNVKKLEALQINHGVILGPLEFAADYQASLQALSKGKLKIKQATSQIFSGQAWLDSQDINLAEPFASQLHINALDITALLKQYPSAEINGTGTLYGELPFKVNLLKKPYITIQKGFLKAKSPGGLLKYQPASGGLKQTHQSMQLVMSVLEDFHYNLLESQVTYENDNKLHLKLKLQGKNPAVESGRQVNFNIQLEEDLPALITSMQISNQVSETIKKRIQSKLENSENNGDSR
ncbi:hypothetical protein THMIRHAM_14320 [Thiomicrorhabdus immobilis]|uniref:Dicarboxylate transport domain-containing protein n=2 Tax=Thiomicrorhabdus immobilis TaxID=2791037 RepID=A0ABM7ME07_9GAMM|nr:hypothetical protein THMIRHAM_14320 [Thiomicrorhabdus immobilis]